MRRPAAGFSQATQASQPIFSAWCARPTPPGVHAHESPVAAPMARPARLLALFVPRLIAVLPVLVVAAASGGQPDPLGYPESVGEPPRTGVPVRRADEPQVPGGLDPFRAPAEAKTPEGLLAWFQEPVPASPCDRTLVDPAWMGPGELAYRLSDTRCDCSRDHTRAFRSEILERLWISADYLLWGTAPQALPPLVTSSPAGTSPADIGVLGRPGTQILFGNETADGPMRSGGRIAMGYWWNPRQLGGVRAEYFGLTNASDRGHFESAAGSTWLARPYLDASTGLPAAVVVPPPGAIPADVSLLSQEISAVQVARFSGFDLLLMHALACEKFHRRYLVGGYRYLLLDDSLTIRDTATIATGAPGGLPLQSVVASDSFRSISQFNGGEIGIMERWWRQRMSLAVTGKVALGASGIGTTINGQTQTTQTTAAGTSLVSDTPGGLLAQPSNIGGHGSTLFAAVGEAGVNADYALWSQCRLSLGFTFLYWTTVGRAAGQIDQAVNPTQFGGGSMVGTAAPAFRLRTSDFWATGVNIGLEYQF